MFKKVEIQLTGPICDCEKGHLEWYITDSKGLVVSCKTCGVSLGVPSKRFVASFKLEEPYNGDKEIKESAATKQMN